MCPPLGAISAQLTDSTEFPECLPPDDLSRGAYKLAQSCLPPAILNHSVRVFRIGEISVELGIREKESPFCGLHPP